MPLVIRSTLYILFGCSLWACASTQVSSTEATSGWGVTVHVESVESGTYSQPEFTFSVHSPSVSGLLIGERYTIVATASKVGFNVEESQWVTRHEAKW